MKEILANKLWCKSNHSKLLIGAENESVERIGVYVDWRAFAFRVQNHFFSPSLAHSFSVSLSLSLSIFLTPSSI